MPLLTDIEVFERTAVEMYHASPKKTLFSTKYRRTGPAFTMKITDGTHCFKIKVVKQDGIRAAEKVVATIMHLMTKE
jgi:hypothetical protein